MERGFGTCTEKLKNLSCFRERAAAFFAKEQRVRDSSSLPRRRRIPPPGIR
jgi:hypothetical protein